jgi:BatD DUF11 like domain
MIGKRLFLFICLGFGFQMGVAQQTSVKVEIGPSAIEMETFFTVTITIQNSDKYEVSDLPFFKGFKKGSLVVKHNQVMINKKKVDQHVIAQNYLAEKPGTFVLPSFEVEVNQKKVAVESEAVVVKAKDEVRLAGFDEREIEDVSLILQSSKSQIFVGESVKITLGFYISDKTTSQWQFPTNLSEQVEAIVKKIRPPDCLESRAVISNIVSQKVIINGGPYSYYKLAEMVYYPLSNKNLQIPVASLSMEKLNGAISKIDVVLKSKPKIVIVKKLPEHPMKEKVVVGRLSISEGKLEKYQYTGTSFDYSFKVSGEANIANVDYGKINKTLHFDFFPNEAKTIQTPGSEQGIKAFSFKIVPKDSGDYSLSDYFSLIYFNTSSGKYDTLRTDGRISVKGKSIKLSGKAPNDVFYGLEDLKTDEKTIGFKKIAKVFANFVVGIMFLMLVYLIKK